MSEQAVENFSGFPDWPPHGQFPLPSAESHGALFGLYCNFDAYAYDLGPAMCLSVGMENPMIAAPGYGALGFGIMAPAVALFPLIVFVVLALMWLGFIVGIVWARRKAVQQGTLPDLRSSDLLSQWRYERNTTVLTFMLTVFGLVMIAFGASGNVELEIPHVRVVTTVPGIAAILFGYLFWMRRYPSHRERKGKTLPEIG